jgi:hypothetical protein
LATGVKTDGNRIAADVIRRTTSARVGNVRKNEPSLIEPVVV